MVIFVKMTSAVSNNPLTDISSLKQVNFVMKEGVIMKSVL